MPGVHGTNPVRCAPPSLMPIPLTRRFMVTRILAAVLLVGLSGAGHVVSRGAHEAQPEPTTAGTTAAALGDNILDIGRRLKPVISTDAPAGPWTVKDGSLLETRSSVVEIQSTVGVLMLAVLYVIIFLICVYTVRHYGFTLNRLFGRQRHPYVPVDNTWWPDVTVVIPAHNEEAVIGHILDALLAADYPSEHLRIMPVDDRSKDRTRQIIESYRDASGGRIQPFFRTEGIPGKAAVLRDALPFIDTEVMLVFDADYVPDKGLIKHLAVPFLDPEIGAVMGRVVPVNTGRNLLTRLLEMERAGGYQVDQQARMNLSLIPQYGGTVGGVRVSALKSVGGWREDSLAEDTDITFRLVLDGWKIVYSNRYECYEEVPESWPVRIRQIQRWARGHTDAALRYSGSLLRKKSLPLKQRLDGLLLLGVYLMAPILLVGWLLAFALFFMGVHRLHGVFAILAVASYNTIGNFAAFFEIAAAVRLDGTIRRIRLLPLNILGFVVSMISVTTAIVSHLFTRRDDTHVDWKKTKRFRVASEGAVYVAT